MDAKNRSSYTAAFINNNVPRDGHLYRFCERLKKQGTLTIADQKQVAMMGFSARSACINYAEKLIKAGLATATRSNGNIVTLKYTGL